MVDSTDRVTAYMWHARCSRFEDSLMEFSTSSAGRVSVEEFVDFCCATVISKTGSRSHVNEASDAVALPESPTPGEADLPSEVVHPMPAKKAPAAWGRKISFISGLDNKFGKFGAAASSDAATSPPSISENGDPETGGKRSTLGQRCIVLPPKAPKWHIAWVETKLDRAMMDELVGETGAKSLIEEARNMVSDVASTGDGGLAPRLLCQLEARHCLLRLALLRLLQVTIVQVAHVRTSVQRGGPSVLPLG